MFSNLARTVYRGRWWLAYFGVAVILVGAFYGIGASKALKSGGLADPRSDSYREAQAEASRFPNAHISALLLMRSDTLTVDQPAFQAAAARLLAALRRDPATEAVTSDFDTPDAHLVSRDRHATYALVGLRGTGKAQDDAYTRLRAALPATGLWVSWGGPVVADTEVGAEVARDIPRAETVSAPLLLLLLVLIFRSLVAALLPLGIGAVSILGALALTRLIATVTDISIFAAEIIALLGLGLAIDYSLLLVSRFRDELAAGKGVPDCLERTIDTAGRSVFFSGCTVTLSLLGLLAFPESFLRSMGLGGALAVAVAMAASLTVLPATLALLGPRVNWGAAPLPRRAGPQVAAQGFWFGLSHWVMRHAVPVLVVTLGLLLAAGIPFLHVRFANPGVESMPASFQARVTTLALRRDFTAGQTDPIQILVHMPADPRTLAQLAALAAYAGRLRAVPGVQDIGSLVTLDARLTPTQYALFYGLPLGGAAQADAESHFLSGDDTLLTLGYAGDSQSPAAQRLLRAVRAVPPPPGATALVGGATAELVDHLASLRAHLPAAAAIVMVATFLLLLWMLQSVLVPLKAILLNVLSLSASFGFMTWVFQDGHLTGLLDFTSSGSVDATIPVLIFALAFGLSTDYEVFLVGRIREEYDRTGDNTESIALGVERTGQIITSAALLLIVVVAAFGASRVLSMKEIGIGLAAAVAIDAAVVRTLLVPATMRVLGDWNWWLPHPFRRRRLTRA